jgi:D-sedoheptulose 7-phosphate isomerase
MKKRAVFLDRDGIINQMVYNPDYGLVDSPIKPDEFNLLPGVGKAIKQINQAGFLAIVISNQPGLAKGKCCKQLLDEITDKMHRTLQARGAKLDGVYYCLHHPEAELEEYRQDCDCRKPKPGLLIQAGSEWEIDLSTSYMIGDGIIDVEAGKAAGTTCFYVGNYKEYIHEEFSKREIEPDYIVGSLPEAVELILKLENGEQGIGTYTTQYLQEAGRILNRIDQNAIVKMVDLLLEVRQRGGRLFLLGSGGGAGNASHAAGDFRKIAGMEAYAPTDNVSELTARVNDDGWQTVFVNWLLGSHLSQKDMLFVFSVGGGDAEKNISPNIVRALELGQQVGATICGIVGRDGGFTAQVAEACVIIPVVNPDSITPHTEAFQALIWHLIVSHPRLKTAEMKWESMQ